MSGWEPRCGYSVAAWGRRRTKAYGKWVPGCGLDCREYKRRGGKKGREEMNILNQAVGGSDA